MSKTENSQSRLKKASTNVRYNLLSYIVKTILSFATRTVFIRVLNSTLLGTTSLFTNLLSMLSIAELGISSAIGFSLYKPLANGDKAKVSSIMSLFRKAYIAIGCVVLGLGLVLSLFLQNIIADFESIDNAYLIYAAFLANTVLSYFISYKEILATADQKSYIISRIQILSDIITNALQIIILILTRNFLLYLGIQIIMQIASRIVINITVSKRYSYIDFRSKEKISKTDSDLIRTNVSAMFFHKIGDYFINGTDSIIISSFINIAAVGIYSNYLTIITMLTSVTNMIFNGILSTVGNIIATETPERQYESHRKIDFAGYIIFSYCTLMLFTIMRPFIKIWAGDDYVLDRSIELIIIANFYLVGMRMTINSIKNAAGLYKVDRFSPLIQSAINIITSIALVQQLGLLGVVIGTITSSILLPMWQRPYLVYKHALKRSSKEYFRRHAGFLLLVLAQGGLLYFVNNIIAVENNVARLAIMGVTTTALFIVVNFTVFKNNKYMCYFKRLASERLHKWTKR